MAKRFTDSRKYQDPWFRKLKPSDKLIWDYMIHACDHAGIWKVDFDLASFCIGATYTYEGTSEALKDKIVIISKSKWFIPKFIEFQYETLNPENRVHGSVINILHKSGINKGLIRGLQGCKDYNKDKDKDKDKYIKEKDFEALYTLYPSKIGKRQALKYFLSSVKTEDDLKNIKIALTNYIKSERVSKGFVQNASTWFNNWSDWINKPLETKSDRRVVA